MASPSPHSLSGHFLGRLEWLELCKVSRFVIVINNFFAELECLQLSYSIT